MAFYRAAHHQKRFIAFFSPKCGCSTIKTWFKGIELPPLPNEQQNIPAEYRKDWVGRDQIYDPFFIDYKKFIFVRDPYHRLVSFYNLFVVHYKNNPGNLWHHVDSKKIIDLKGCTFEQFMELLLSVYKDPNMELQHHLEHQAKDTEKVDFDYILKVDKLNTELRQISEDLELNAVVPPAVNVSDYNYNLTAVAYNKSPASLRLTGTPYYPYFYNDRLREIVELVYASDIQLYKKTGL